MAADSPTAVPSARWRDVLGEPKRTARGVTWYPNADRTLAYETMIEVIDAASGRLVASGRFPGYVRFRSSGARSGCSA